MTLSKWGLGGARGIGLTLVAATLMVFAGCDETFSAADQSASAPTQAAAKPAALPTAPPPAPEPARPAPPVGQQPAHPTLGPPPIEFDPPLLDFGTIKPGQRLNGTIYIHNVGDKPLRIAHTKADCTCTTVNLANVTIAPGERIGMLAEYQSGLMGEKKSGIRVWVDGYDMVEASIKALVSLPVKAEPWYINALRDKDGHQSLAGLYTVQSLDGAPFRVLAVNAGPVPYVDFDPQRDQPRSSYQLKWDLSDYNQETCLDRNGQRMPGWVIVETDHPECPVLDLEIRHNCARRQIKPSDAWAIGDKRVLVGGMKPGEPVEFEVVAKWLPRKQQLDRIQSVVSDSPQFSAELLEMQPVEDGMRCRVRVTAAPGHQGLVYGVLRVRSEQQDAPVTIIGAVR